MLILFDTPNRFANSFRSPNTTSLKAKLPNIPIIILIKAITPYSNKYIDIILFEEKPVLFNVAIFLLSVTMLL
jgi:hypothetical protein